MVMSPPASPCDGNCIYAPNLLVADQVTACAGITDINISPVTVACSGVTPKYTILSSKNVTGTPTITSTKVTFTPANNNYAPGEIVYKVSCGMLSRSGKIIIVYKNECLDKTCPTGQICDKCTGLCIAAPIDLSADGIATSASDIFSTDQILREI
jgi:hypothetical protein